VICAKVAKIKEALVKLMEIFNTYAVKYKEEKIV